jgi:5'-3' exonuclease
MIVGKDCKREDIWRIKLQNNYKGNRNVSGFMGTPFFKMVHDEKLFEQAGIETILKHPSLEADDCIALSVKHLLKTKENIKVYIITSDKDYLQLIEPRVEIFDLSFTNIAHKKTSMKDPKIDLFCKIVMGDISDNISSVLKKCGPKTALKCYNDNNYFEERMKKENAYKKFVLNKTMIDFNCIPIDLIEEFTKNTIYKNNIFI